MPEFTRNTTKEVRLSVKVKVASFGKKEGKSTGGRRIFKFP